MSEIIKRVAKAVFAANRPDFCAKHRDEIWANPRAEEVRNVARDIARAAIGAMREPTEEMNESAKPFRKGVGETAERLYRAMIDVALTEKQP